MKIMETIKVFFALFLLLILLLTNHQILANDLSMENPIVKAANTTLHFHDEVEDYKILQKVPDTRKKRLMIQTQTCV